jgi:hypothetical protein
MGRETSTRRTFAGYSTTLWLEISIEQRNSIGAGGQISLILNILSGYFCIIEIMPESWKEH